MALTQNDIVQYIEGNIPSFHSRRLEKLMELDLHEVLKRKNPYLFRAKNMNDAPELVKNVLDAYLSSQEETIFGSFLEGLAVFVCQKIHGGRKSAAEGIDIEFEKEGIIYLLVIKSGPNWGNSRQIAKMKDDFRRAKRILGTNTKRPNVIAVNGCCYGRQASENQGDYIKICGERFWTFISDIPTLYTDIIEPLGHRAKERNEDFAREYSKVTNRFTGAFISEFCTEDGQVLWDKLVRFNSSAEKPPRKRKKKSSVEKYDTRPD